MSTARQILKRLLVLTICVLALLCLSSASSPTHAQADAPRFEPSECPMEVPAEPSIDCGYLIAPEDYGDPAGSTIRLPVIVIHSRSESPAPDPLLFVAGGPGENALSFVRPFASSPYVESRDVVILQPRGGLYAEPSLDCEYAQLADQGQPCLKSLLDRGIDLTHYNTQAMAADLDALRQALDYNTWNLYGESYGSRLLLLHMFQYPEGIRSVVLDSAAQPTVNKYEEDPAYLVRALKALFDDCAADPGCAAVYPELETQLYALIDRLNTEPVTVDVYDNTTGQPVAVVDGDRLLDWINWALYQPASPAHPLGYLPLLIDQLDSGNTDLLLPWVAEQRSWDGILTWGLYFATVCQDQFPNTDSDAIAAQAVAHPELGGWQNFAYERALCEAWTLPGTRRMAAGPVESDIPTLILAGQYDHVTPAAGARAVATSLDNSYFYELPGMGHFPSAYSPCAQSIIADFLGNPSVAPDASCIADMPEAEFVLPQEVTILPGLYRVTFNVGQTGFEEVLYMICLVIFVAEIGFLVVAGILLLMRRRRRATPTDRFGLVAHLVAGSVALLNLDFALAVQAVLRTLVDTNRLVLRFGVPAEYEPLFILPVVPALLTVVLVILAVLLWIRGTWSVTERVFFSVVTMAAVVFTTLLAYWGLLALPF